MSRFAITFYVLFLCKCRRLQIVDMWVLLAELGAQEPKAEWEGKKLPVLTSRIFNETMSVKT
jgi:hypothetical protein